MSPAKFRWGILFILVGGLLLLNNIGSLEWWVWNDILSWWPLLLIAIGIEKIFVRTRLEVFSYLSTIALAVIVVYIASPGFVRDDNFTRYGDHRYRYSVDKEPGVTKLSGVFDVDDNDIQVSASRTDLMDARISGSRRLPAIDYQLDNGEAKFKINERGLARRGIGGHLFGRNIIRVDYPIRSSDWNFRIADHIPANLKFEGDDADMRLDLRSVEVDDLDVDSRNGLVRIYLGDLRDFVRVSLVGIDANFRIVIPKDAGIRIDGETVSIERFLEKIGLIETDGVFETAGYDTLSPQVELRLNSEVSQFDLDYH